MALAGTVKTVFNKFKFQVEVDGFAAASFQKCSAIEHEVQMVEHYEGGSIVPSKTPGLLKITPVTLERGASSDDDFFTWCTAVVSLTAAGVGALNTGLPDPLYKRNVDVVQYDNDGSELQRWTLYGAWPTKFSTGDWDNTSNEKRIETLTLEYDFYDQTK